MPSSVVIARLVMACLLASGLALAAVRPVAAHAELETSTTAANASVGEAPDAITLSFTESIEPGSATVELLDRQGLPVEPVGTPVVDPAARSLTVALPALAPDVYTVSYQVVSTVDGHATAGVFAFLVDPTGAAPPPASSEEASSPSVDALTVSARWLALVAGLAALGSMTMWWFAGRPVLRDSRVTRRGPPWMLVAGACALCAVGIAAYLALVARPLADAGGTGIPLDIGAPFGWTPFAVAMRISFLAAVGVATLGVVAELRGWSGPRAPTVATGLLAVVLAGMSAAAHAAAAGGPPFAAIDWIHLVAVAAWLGGLPAAALLAARAAGARRRALWAILRRHGRVALVAAPVVALTGIANSPLVLGSRRDLVASDYGNLLLAKGLLLSVAVGIGAVNRLALRGRGRAGVAALVSTEVVVAIIAVATAATMVTIQPSSAREAELISPPVNTAHLFGTVGPSRVHASVSLPAPGTQSYRVTVSDADSAAPRADVEKVFLTFVPPEGTDAEPQRVELEADPVPGLYATTGAYTPYEGEWRLEVTVRRSRAPDEAIDFALPVASAASAELGPPPDTGIGVPAPIGAVWSLLPGGAAAWLPALAALALAVALGRLRPTFWRSVARGAAAAVLVVTASAAGSEALVTAANSPSADELAAQPQPRGSGARGPELYLANCASCHGPDGEGDGPVRTLPEAGPLEDVVRGASDAELSYRVAYGIAGTPMPPFAGLLTADERGELVAYLRDRWGQE